MMNSLYLVRALRSLTISLFLAGLTIVPSSAQSEFLLLDPDRTPNDPLSMFGSSVAVSGNWVLVGSSRSIDGFPKVHLFERENDEWTSVASFDGGSTAGGRPVALDGDRALVGHSAYVSGSAAVGAAIVYDRVEGEWMPSAPLLADDREQDDLFGFSVALDGERALVGAPGSDTEPGGGAAYIFERQEEGSWVQMAKLVPDDAAERRQVGWFVALNGDRALVGCQGELESNEYTTNCLTAVFERQSDGSWTQAAQIVSPDAAAENQNALSAALDGDRALIGMGIFPPSTFHQQRAYVFERESDGSWMQVQHLVAEGGLPAVAAGASVDLDGDRALLGAPAGTLGGAAYLFERAGESWMQTAEITTDLTYDDSYGFSVALDGDVAAVGIFGPFEHAAYAYSGITSTEVQNRDELPRSVSLKPLFPNPFNPRAVIPFELPVAVRVKLEIFDVAGRRLATLVDGVRAAGRHEVGWDAAGVPSGVYLVRLAAGLESQVRFVVLQK